MSKEMYEDREQWRALLHAEALRYFDYGRKGRPIRTNEDAFRALFDAAPLEYDEAMASLLIILTFNGIPAWNGDGTSIIAQAITKLSATVAALTAENQRLRETLTLGLGEQESVIAGLRAENERMREAVRCLQRFECTMGGCGDPECCGSYPEMEPADAGEWVRHADIVAALPSSRETTDDPTPAAPDQAEGPHDPI